MGWRDTSSAAGDSATDERRQAPDDGFAQPDHEPLPRSSRRVLQMTDSSGMRREKVDMAVFAAVPGFVRVSVRLRGGDDGSPTAAARALLERASAKSLDAAEAQPHAKLSWQDAYSLVGLPPDTVPPHEALAAWAATEGGVPTQGLLLDVLNAFSLEHRIPVSAYDLAHATGDLWLRPSRGYELHESPAGDAVDTPPMGELILADSADLVMARRWHGTAGLPTAAYGAPENALVHLDLLSPPAPVVDALEDAVCRLMTGFVGGRIDAQRVHRAVPAIAWAE